MARSSGWLSAPLFHRVDGEGGYGHGLAVMAVTKGRVPYPHLLQDFTQLPEFQLRQAEVDIRTALHPLGDELMDLVERSVESLRLLVLHAQPHDLGDRCQPRRDIGLEGVNQDPHRVSVAPRSLQGSQELHEDSHDSRMVLQMH